MSRKIYCLILLLSTCSFGVSAAKFLPNNPDSSATGNVTVEPTVPVPVLSVHDDNLTVVPNRITSVSGNVTDNDSNGIFGELISLPVSKYGYLVMSPDGSYTYTLYENDPSVFNLKVGDVVVDSFEYSYVDTLGSQSLTARLNFTIIGNPVDGGGNTVFDTQDIDEVFDNVDIEFNNRSTDATPLNSGQNIKGHLKRSNDIDWFSLAKAENESIVFEVCPKGSSCFGKKSWVLYIFDSEKLTLDMQETLIEFSRWVDETGSTVDLPGNQIISESTLRPGFGVSSAGLSNHMYLLYRLGVFDDALIGIVDPCFDVLNAVELGVEAQAKEYFVAISSPLEGEADGPSDACGQGSVILKRAGFSATGIGPDGKPKSYSTTEEYIAIAPLSDDQYTINVTRTGRDPLLSDKATARFASYDSQTGRLFIPRIKVNNNIFQATLNPSSQQGKSTGDMMKFILSSIDRLTVDDEIDAYRATYNPDNQQIMIPWLTDTQTGKAYSVIMQYHDNASGEIWLDVIDIKAIQ